MAAGPLSPRGGWGGDADSFGYDELQSSMREIATFSRGDTTKGTIIGFEPNGALVEIGVKSSAYCTLQEMALVKPNKPEEALEVGAEYDFVIVSREDENGQLMLSRRRILFSEAWDRVAQLYADDAVVEGEVSAVNRGGAMMLVEGLRAFLPGSHFLAGQTPTEEFIGRKVRTMPPLLCCFRRVCRRCCRCRVLCAMECPRSDGLGSRAVAQAKPRRRIGGVSACWRDG